MYYFESTFLIIFLLTSSSIVDTAAQEEAEIYNNCVEAHQKACHGGRNIDRSYFIKSRTSAGFESTKCHSAQGGFLGAGCTGNGWTYIGVLNSSKLNEATSYDSPIWTAKGENQTNFNSQFWSANVTEVCLTSDLFSIQLPVQAPSLRSLFFQKKILNVNETEWLSNLASNAHSFTPGCYESGFNVGDSNWVRARIGIVGLSEREGCSGSINAVGVGIKLEGQALGSAHGAWSDPVEEFTDVSVYVRSQ